MAHTLQEILVAGLLALGETEQPKRSSRYRIFSRTKNTSGTPRAPGDLPLLWYVGKAGVLRSGPNLTCSRSFGDTQPYKNILTLGRTRLGLIGPKRDLINTLSQQLPLTFTSRD